MVKTTTQSFHYVLRDNSQLTNSQSQALAENNSTFNTQHSTFYFPIRLTARAERYCGGEPFIQLLLDDAAKERC